MNFRALKPRINNNSIERNGDPIKTLLAAIVAASTLLVATESRSCEAVQAIVAPQVYSQAIVAAPIVYQPQVVQQFVAQPVSYSVVAPVVQQQIIVRQRVRVRHPVRNTLRVVLPPYGCGR